SAESELIEPDERFGVEDPKHSVFAERSRQNRYAKVDGSWRARRPSRRLVVSRHDASVLGGATLRDVQTGQDLDARDGLVDVALADGGRELPQHTVDTHANIDVTLIAFDVQVTRAGRDREPEERRDHVGYGAMRREVELRRRADGESGRVDLGADAPEAD